MNYRRAKTWQLASAMMTNGANMTFYTLMTYVSYIANQGYGIAVAVTGIIMTATRLFDGVTDPVLALMADRINTKHGKIRILLWLGFLVEALAVSIMFLFGSNGKHGIVLFVISYMLYIIGYTIFGIAGNTINPIITNDPKQRPMLMLWSTLYSYFFPAIWMVVIQAVILPRFGGEYTTPMLRTVCVVCVVFAALCIGIVCMGVRHIDKPENFVNIRLSGEKDAKIGVRDMLQLIKSNRALQTYAVAAASDKLALQTGGQAVITTMLYGICIGNMGVSTILQAIAGLPSIIFIYIGARMAGKRGNKETMVLWTWVCMIISIISMVFCFAIDMRSITVSIVPTIIFFGTLLLLNASKMCVSSSSAAMMSDIVDYEFNRSGNFMPGTVSATYTFIDKLVSSLSSTVATVSIALIGYTSTMPQPTDEPTMAIKALTLILFFGLPIIAWICTIVAMKFCPLSKDMMVQVQRENQEKRNSAKGQEAV